MAFAGQFLSFEICSPRNCLTGNRSHRGAPLPKISFHGHKNQTNNAKKSIFFYKLIKKYANLVQFIKIKVKLYENCRKENSSTFFKTNVSFSGKYLSYQQLHKISRNVTKQNFQEYHQYRLEIISLNKDPFQCVSSTSIQCQLQNYLVCLDN